MLINEYLPEFDVAERHAVTVAAPAERTWEAVRRLDLSRSPSVRILFALRGLPWALLRRPSSANPGPRRRGRRWTARIDDFVRGGFVVLGEDPGAELLLGVVGRFWRPTGGLRRIAAEEFERFSDSGYAKAAWNLCVEARGDDASVVWTETRIGCTDERARRRFLLYWAVIGPASGFIRKRALSLVKRDAEASPGRGYH